MKILLDEYNSKIFNLRMGNIVDYDHCIDALSFNSIIDNSSFNHLSIKINTNNKEIANLFLKNGFYLVDTQITYKLKLENQQFEKNVNVQIATQNEAREIAKIAKNSFSLDRFHSDTNLSKEKANNYYKQWALNLLDNISIISLVYKDNNKINGFSFWKIEHSTAKLILVAVSNKERGKGIYGKMISHFLNTYSKNIKEIFMGTQINNYPVHKYWSKLGAEIVESNYVLHKVI